MSDDVELTVDLPSPQEGEEGEEGGAAEPEPDPVDDCIFCRIVAGEVRADIVFEDDDVVGFKDVRPKAPTHVLVVPRQHLQDWPALADADPAVGAALVRAVAATARAVGLDSYRIVSNTGTRAGQTVFHLHFHVMGGRPMLWPPG